MEFLFSCELKKELPGAAAFDLFMESVKEEFALLDNRITRRAQDYAVKLYECVTLKKSDLDAIIAKYCRNWDLDRLSIVDRNIMRVAVAEMSDFPEVPAVVSIDEAVEIARDFSGADAGNFINGVMIGKRCGSPPISALQRQKKSFPGSGSVMIGAKSPQMPIWYKLPEMKWQRS